MKGFVTEVLENVRLNAGVPASIRPVLSPGGVAETVVVEAAGEVLKTTQTSVATTLTQQQIMNLPLPGRAAFDLVTFMPGVTFYADTPVVQTTAFADQYNHPDCNYPDATPAVKEVDGDGIGPWVQNAYGAIQSISLSSGGSGYTSTPTVTISDGAGSGAAATATIGNGTVAHVNVTNGGRGYTSAPSVTFAAPATGTTATGTAVMTGSAASVRMTSGG